MIQPQPLKGMSNLNFELTFMEIQKAPPETTLIISFITSLGESGEYTGFTSFARFDLCAQYLKIAVTGFIPTWHRHVFGSGEEPYFKVTLNSK